MEKTLTIPFILSFTNVLLWLSKNYFFTFVCSKFFNENGNCNTIRYLYTYKHEPVTTAIK